MYRLLIVDDEEIILESLYNYLRDLDDLELDIYKTDSAEEALEWLNKARMDIVLSDICMPGMSGLELLTQIKERWPRCRVVFLTGYNSFDYVYTASKYDGVQYLLKSEGYMVLEKAVRRVISDLEQRFKERKLLDELEQRAENSVTILQRDFLVGLLRGEYDTFPTRKQLNELEITMSASKPVLLLLSRIENLPPDMTFSEKMKTAGAVNSVLAHYVPIPGCQIQMCVYQHGIIWFFQQAQEEYAANENKRIPNVLYIYENLDDIQRVCKTSMALSLSFILADSFVPWDKLKEKYEILKHSIECAESTGTEIILYEKDSEVFGIQEYSFKHVVQELQSYVEEHLNEDLSLIKLAEIVHFNPSYLSRVFKKETNVNLFNYIRDIRIHKAKEMLSKTRMKIGEVAQCVGFGSSKYFASAFKKAANMTPQEWVEKNR